MAGRMSLWMERGRHRLVTEVVDAVMHGAAAVASLFPRFDLESRGFRVHRDLRYAAHPDCALDVYAPADSESAPVVIYLHGGGFKLGSKRSHAVVAEPLVSAGFVVVLVDYRLAPSHPFPAALDDCAEAYLWTVANVERFGGDPTRILLGGESAGGNLSLGIALASTRRFVRPSMRRVFDVGVVPRVVFPLCGYLQVSDPDRIVRDGRTTHPIVADRMRSVSRTYLDGADGEHGLDLADPLVLVESDLELDRAFPPVFVSCGDRDPILDDSLRLAHALARRGIVHTLRIEPGELHGYQPVVITPGATRHWIHAIDFFRAHTA